MSGIKMDPSTEDRFKKFLKARCNILKEINEFLIMVLNYFFEMEEKIGFETVVEMMQQENVKNSVKSLIKSLCFLHGLYGYPAETDELPDKRTPLEFNAEIEDFIYRIARDIASNSKTDSELTEEAKILLRHTVINKGAIKNIFLNKINKKTVTKDKKNRTIQFESYCGREINRKKFWNFTFDDQFKPESLPREPAHCFLQLVRDMFNSSNGEVLASVGRIFLESLPADNGLKPSVWAHQKETQEKNFGVSLGVQNFVRPLYLCIKLTQLSDDKKCELKDVKAIKIQEKDADKDVVKNPCVSCQYFFGFQSIPPLGNCAEYDVIGNVNHSGLLGTTQWSKFRSACQQHFDAFKNMLRNLKHRSSKSSQEILKEYYNSTCNPEKPKILRYRWDPESEAKGGFELIDEQ